jgi:hypothetical protein
MAKSDGTFVLIGTYPDETTARADYDAVKDLHFVGVVGTYDAAVVTKDGKGKIHVNKDEAATRRRCPRRHPVPTRDHRHRLGGCCSRWGERSPVAGAVP